MQWLNNKSISYKIIYLMWPRRIWEIVPIQDYAELDEPDR